MITISHLGYVKRTALSEFREQSRGGVGSKGANTRDEDFTEYIYPATMHNTLLFFTQKGRCYWLKCYEIPEGAKNAKGRAIQNLLNIESVDAINAVLRIKKFDDAEFLNTHYVVFATKNGLIKKTCLEAYSRPRANGVIAINIMDDDQVVGVRLTNGNNEIVLANRNGRAIRFNESDVRTIGACLYRCPRHETRRWRRRGCWAWCASTTHRRRPSWWSARRVTASAAM